MKDDIKLLKKKAKILREASTILRVEDSQLPRVVERFLQELKEMESKIKRG